MGQFEEFAAKGGRGGIGSHGHCGGVGDTQMKRRMVGKYCGWVD